MADDAGRSQDVMADDAGRCQEVMADDAGISQEVMEDDAGRSHEVMADDAGRSLEVMEDDAGRSEEVMAEDAGRSQEVMEDDAGRSEEVMAEDAGRSQEVIADARDGSSLGLDEVPNGVGQATHFLSASRSFRNGELHSDATSSSTYYSTAPQELWTELLPEYLQHQNLVFETQSEESECGWVEVVDWYDQFRGSIPHDEIYLEQLLAEGGEAHVYSVKLGDRQCPFVCKRYKQRNVDLFRLRRRMKLVMKARKENNSAICGVYGVGLDPYGNVLLLMEPMAGDLRTLIDDRMIYLTDGEMPFEYTQTITMMIRIAQGMEDLHRCDCIHGDLKASNILVNPVVTKSEVEQVDGSHLNSVTTHFDVKIGDFDSYGVQGTAFWRALVNPVVTKSEVEQVDGSHLNSVTTHFDVKIGDFDSYGVQGTAFWRAPEVLQAVKDRTKPTFSPAIDVYSYAMLCYELLTGYIPLGEYRKGNYDVVLSGQRPELPAHVNKTVKELMHACWRAEPGERPGWAFIIQTLKEELKLQRLVSPQPNNCAKMRSEWEWSAIKHVAGGRSLSFSMPEIPWEEAFARQLHNREEGKQFITWKEKILPELLPQIMPIVTVMQDIFNFVMLPAIKRVDDVWRKVEKTWTSHVWRTAADPLSNDVVNMLSNASEPCNLLGSTAKQWVEEILATSEKWQELRQEVHPWWGTDRFQEMLFAWNTVYNTFQDWHFESAIAFITWQIVNDMYLNWKKYMGPSKFINKVVVKIYLEVDNGRELDVGMEIINAWKKSELEKVTIRKYFLKSIQQLTNAKLARQDYIVE